MPTTAIEPAGSGYVQALSRVNQIMNPAAAATAASGGPVATGFAARLSSAISATPAGPMIDAASGGFALPVGVTGVGQVGAVGAGGTTGQRIAALATAELGVAEQPPGSNDSPRIAEYRTATAGSAVGPWCAYFTSWVAAQAGVPIGANGAGEGWVPSVRDWAVSQGRYITAGAGTPAVGDLVLFDRGGDGLLDHIGIVTGVGPDGAIQTVEGNSSDAVSARSYGPGEYAGLVRLG